jgi:hypothetical protein
MMSPRNTGPPFQEGDEVVLADGTYQGTLGVFLRLRKDVKWSDIRERNGSVRSHPVAWLAPSTVGIPGPLLEPQQLTIDASSIDVP